MRHLPLLSAAFLFACGDDSVVKGDPDLLGDIRTDTVTGRDDADADTFDTALDTLPIDTASSNVSPCTGVNVAVTVTTPTPNPSCDPRRVEPGPFGYVYPWGGATLQGKNYTCNKCPGGLRDFQGKWRAHGFTEGGDPDYSLGAEAGPDDAELLFIDGNTFYSRIYDRQTDVTVELRGWFFCGQQPEQPNEHLYWFVLEANPAGTWGYDAGTVFESDVILSWGNDRKLIIWFDELGASTSADIGYCQIGTTAGGQFCNDPFAP